MPGGEAGRGGSVLKGDPGHWQKQLPVPVTALLALGPHSAWCPGPAAPVVAKAGTPVAKVPLLRAPSFLFSAWDN